MFDSKAKMDPNHERLIQAFGMIQGESLIDTIADFTKEDPAETFKVIDCVITVLTTYRDRIIKECDQAVRETQTDLGYVT